jgi:hypothetical protein
LSVADHRLTKDMFSSKGKNIADKISERMCEYGGGSQRERERERDLNLWVKHWAYIETCLKEGRGRRERKILKT